MYIKVKNNNVDFKNIYLNMSLILDDSDPHQNQISHLPRQHLLDQLFYMEFLIQIHKPELCYHFHQE